MEERLYRIALSRLPAIGHRRFSRLLQAYGSGKEAWLAGPRRWREVLRLSAEQEGEIRRRMASLSLDEPLAWEARGIRCLLQGDAHYPPLLQHIFDPPPVLYYRGVDLPWGERILALVGTRKASAYGRMMAQSLARDLAAQGVTVVSGLAKGIDGAAHRGALEGGGLTLAVLACGVDVIYPRDHAALAGRILEQGALVSEYPPGTQPEPGRFPARNRIISGLSMGVVVVEGEVTSGSLITADFALEQGRDVYAVPGPVNVRGSRGPHRLLKQGAKLVEGVGDLLEDMAAWEPREQRGDLSPDEVRVLALLEEEGLTPDGLQSRSGLEWGRLNAALGMLEVKGYILQVAGQLYVKCV